MKKVICLLLSLSLIAVSCGCASVLDGEDYSVTPHIEAGEQTDEADVIDVNSEEELQTEIQRLIRDHSTGGTLHLYGFGEEESQVREIVENVCLAAAYEDPYGIYSVYYIKNDVSRIVSYYEAQISITYKRTKTQVNSIINVSSLRFFHTEIEEMMELFSTYRVYYTELPAVSPESIATNVEDAYYNNPIQIVMCPEVTVEMYPKEGGKRIYEVMFGYPYSSMVLRNMADRLESAVQQAAESVTGDNDADILQSLCAVLMDTAEYDSVSAESSEHTRQEVVMTAYGALVDGLAVGEGYAMAYKALCDELGIDCRIVHGRLNGIDHAWNIVELEGNYYHVDVAMCDVGGIDSAFLKGDESFSTDHWWEQGVYPVCPGNYLFGDKVETNWTDGGEEYHGEDDSREDYTGENDGGQSDFED